MGEKTRLSRLGDDRDDEAAQAAQEPWQDAPDSPIGEQIMLAGVLARVATQSGCVHNATHRALGARLLARLLHGSGRNRRKRIARSERATIGFSQVGAIKKTGA